MFHPPRISSPPRSTHPPVLSYPLHSLTPPFQVLVVANPANTNALILKEYAPDVAPENITCLTRLDHNRALAQVWELGDRGERGIHQQCDVLLDMRGNAPMRRAA